MTREVIETDPAAGAEPVSLSPSDRPELWHGAVCFEDVDGWSQPWRLPPEGAALAYAPELYAKARIAAGVRVGFITDGTRLSLELEALEEETRPVDVLIEDTLKVRSELVLGRNHVDVELPGTRSQITVWLPQMGAVRVGRLVVQGGTVDPIPAKRTRWVTYGSSITQCSASLGPSETWPALVARELDADLLCLGFGGQCHLDPIVEQTIAAQPADVISMCLGINVYGGGSYAPRTWPGQVAEFIRQVRKAHPDIPMLVMSPIASPERETKPNSAGLTLSEIREAVATVVSDLQQREDVNLHYLSGPTVLGLDQADLLHDGLHPGPQGYRLMARGIADALAGLVS